SVDRALHAAAATAAVARGLSQSRAARAGDADLAAPAGADRRQARRAVARSADRPGRARNAVAIRRSFPLGAAPVAPAVEPRARDQGPRRARATATARGRALPA